MRTSDRLHGSVVPCDGRVEGLGVPHLDIMRIVTYPLRRIECMLERLQSAPNRVAEVVQASDSWVRARVQTAVWPQYNVLRLYL